MLGVEINGDTKVLARLELHPTHKPWHAHVSCGPIDNVPSGVKQGSWVRNLNRGNDTSACPMKDSEAFAKAAQFFRLDKTSVGGML